MKSICIFILLLALFGIAAADVLVLKDGRQIQARGFWMEKDQVKWVGDGKINSLSCDQMAALEWRNFDPAFKSSEYRSSDSQTGSSDSSDNSGDAVEQPHPQDNVVTSAAVFEAPSGAPPASAAESDQPPLPDEAQPSADAPPPAPEAGAAGLNQQARLLIKDGRYTDTDQALSLLEQAMAADPAYSETYHNLGQVYLASEDYEDAADNFRKALALDMKKLGPEHALLAPSYYNLGIALYKMDDYDGAAENYRQALTIRQAHPEISFPAVQMLHNRLGLAYSALDDFDRSIDHYLKALEIVRNTMGPDHLETAVICNNLGAAYFKKKDYDGATRYFQQALDIRRGRLGEDHPSVTQVREYLDMAAGQQQSSATVPAETP